jgi:hypothetical protein
VVMTLTARDEGGNEGRSEPFAFRLPERAFTKPLAKALVEQRRNLALDARVRSQVKRNDRVIFALPPIAASTR